MRTRSESKFTSRTAPLAVEAVQTLAGVAMLASVVLLLATMMSPDLVLRGPASQLASPVSLLGLLLLTIATVLLDRELVQNGLRVEPAHALDEAVDAPEAETADEEAAEPVLAAEEPSVAVEEPPVAVEVEAPPVAFDEPSVLVLSEPAITVRRPAPVARVEAPQRQIISLESTWMLPAVAHADPPEPRAHPIEDEPWWMPWMERGSRSVFEGPASAMHHPDHLRIDLSDARSDQLVGAA